MNIFYLITIIVLYFVLLFLGKGDKKKNFVITSVFTLGILYFANILLISILSLFKIQGNFIILSVLNFLFIFLILFINYKYNNHKIKIQKFDYNLKEIICMFLIICLCFFIGCVRFNNFNDINYETTDPAAHYKAAMYFSENMNLLTESNSSDIMYNDFSHFMPGFSLNCGILISILSFIPSYIVYMIYDVMILCLLALTFYITCLKIKKISGSNVILFLLTCLYLGGYALNNMVFGFGYLGIGILATNLIVLTWLFLEEAKTNSIIYYLLLFLFNYSLFFSYYLFMPTLYLAQGLYLIYNWLNKKKSFKEILIIGIGTLIIPFIIGMIYFILPGFMSSSSDTNVSSAIASEGYIYRDLWSNFILIAPLVIISAFRELKSKRKTFMLFLIITEVCYIFVTFILGLKGYISSYYYFKAYYIFWLFCYIYIVKLVNLDNNNYRNIFKFNVFYICIIVLICLSNLEQEVQERNILFNNTIVSPSYANIYWFNASKVNNQSPILNSNELQLINKVKDIKNQCLNNNEIPVIGNYLQKLWFYSINNIVPIYNHTKGDLSRFYDEKFDYNLWLDDSNSKCLVIFNNANQVDSENYISIDYNNYEILYYNKYGYIIKK